MATIRTRATLATAAVVTVATLVSGCGKSSDESSPTTKKPTTTAEPTTTTTEPEEGRGDIIPDEPVDEPGATVPESMVTISDPVNEAFSVQVPDGWDSVAYSNVEGQVVRQVVNSVSPDGGTVVFVGDPKLPSYWDPDYANEMTVRFAEMLDSMELARYSPADEFVVNWANEKFGELDGFTMGNVERRGDMEERIQSSAAQRGVQLADARVAELHFGYNDADGTPTQAAVTVATLNNGPAWTVELFGAATDTGDVAPFLQVASDVSATRETNPAFAQVLQQRHNDTMSLIDQRTREMTQRHQANMQWIQDSANAHQQRMQGIWAANDASMQRYRDRMASDDVQHRQFLNYINDERTVQDSSGVKRQVDDGYQRYWMNPSTGQYLGGDINFGESQIRELGENPSNFEEVQIVKG